MSAAQEFPPQKIRDVVVDVARLLKERGETVSVAETVSWVFDLWRFGCVDWRVVLKEGGRG
jgi:hypothetical protein